MRFPQIVVFESDGVLAANLQPLAKETRWLVREPKQVPACLDLLRESGPKVLLLRLGRHLIRELTLLDEASSTNADVPVIVVCDNDDPALLSVAMDLGASYVLMPPLTRHILPELIEKVMRAQSEPTLARIASPTPVDPPNLTDADHDD